MMNFSTSLIRIRYAVGILLALSAVFAVVIGTSTLQHDRMAEAQSGSVVNFGSGTGSAAEGGNVTVTVSLGTNQSSPTDPIYIVATNGTTSNNDYSGVAKSVSVETGQSSATFTVTFTNDDVDEDDEYLTLSFGQLPAGMTKGSIPTMRLTITDNDTKSVTVTETGNDDDQELTVAEGAEGSYTVVLGSQPTSNVTISTRVNTGGSDVSTDPSSLTFTPSNWNTAQTIKVKVAEDDDAIVDSPVSIIHTAVGGDYAGFSIDSVNVTTTENDTPGATISPAGGLEVVEGGHDDGRDLHSGVEHGTIGQCFGHHLRPRRYHG